MISIERNGKFEPTTMNWNTNIVKNFFWYNKYVSKHFLRNLSRPYLKVKGLKTLKIESISCAKAIEGTLREDFMTNVLVRKKLKKN